MDIDNVVAQTDVVIRDLIRRHTASRVNLGYEDIRDFDYWKCLDCNGGQITRLEWDMVHDKFSTPEVIGALLPLEGAQKQLIALRDTYSVHLVSSRKPGAHVATEHWLAKHAIPFDELIFTTHGRKHELPGKYVLVVEDHYEQAKAFAENGVKAILVDHPWNRGRDSHANLRWVRTWNDIRAPF